VYAHRFFFTPPPSVRQMNGSFLSAVLALVVVASAFFRSPESRFVVIALVVLTTMAFLARRYVRRARANRVRARFAGATLLTVGAVAVALGTSDGGACSGQFAPSRSIDLISWNINSGVDSTGLGQIHYVQDRIRAADGIELFALTEVHPAWVGRLEAAAEASGRPYGMIVSESGHNQRVALLFDESRFEHLGGGELHGVASSDWHRNPVLVALLDRSTGVRFEVAVVHLPRSNGEFRRQEAARLNQLLRRGDTPIVVAGDFNVDCPVGQSPHGCDAAFNELTRDNVLHWRRPAVERETTCDARYNEMLDLVFAGRGADRWSSTVQVVHDASFCTNMRTGAHYPVHTSFVPTR
jgi:endonuclease/exonuclease/phosphatase family metal-dependent hydrolase